MPTTSQIYKAEFLRNQKLYERRISRLFGKVARDIAVLRDDPQAKFVKSYDFTRQKRLSKKIDAVMAGFEKDYSGIMENGVKESWNLANVKNDKIIDKYTRTLFFLSGAQAANYYDYNTSALKAFINSDKSFSNSIWKVRDQFRRELELHLGLGITNGDSADTISRRVRRYLKNPENLFRRVRDEKGNLVLSKNAKEYHPGRGVYRSSYKNAMRLTRTTTNQAYLSSDFERWNQLDFVTGIRVVISANHFDRMPGGDICDQVQGVYPKNFKFVGWHPQCYSNDTEVYTKEGWKLFKDVVDSDLILSLNPETKNIEWSEIVQRIQYKRHDKMIRFYNNALDMLVTPDHKMVYVTKDGKYEIRQNKLADNYSSFNGGLYRGCEYASKEKETIVIGEEEFQFNHFAEFMGFYLSEGSWSRKYCVVVSQSKEINPKQYKIIQDCIKKLNVHFTPFNYGFRIHNKSLYEYVQKFGKSSQKYIPDEIKDAGVNNIKAFLGAFNIGDGSTRKAKKFTGNRGGEGISKTEVVYSTSSVKMADDLGELIFKSGKRPSFYIAKTKGKKQKFANGEYTINNNHIVIRECRSHTSTQFKKEYIDYSGYVYDVELKKNHILWVRRNGKTVWGSNCLCSAVPILMNSDDFDRQLMGEEVETKYIKDVPKGFDKWITENAERAKGWKNTPYFIRDNFKNGNIAGGLKLPSGPVALKGGRGIFKDIKPAAPENKFVPAKTVSELREKMSKDLSITISDKNNLNVNILNEISNEYYNLSKVYKHKPFNVTSFVQAGRETSKGASVGKQVGNSNKLRMTFNETLFNSKTKLKNWLEKNERENWFPKDCKTTKAIVDHEFSHILTRDFIRSENGEIWKALVQIESRYKHDLELGKNIYRWKSQNPNFVSAYANRDTHEFIAECFTSALNSKNPSPYAVEVKELIDKYFKR